MILTTILIVFSTAAFLWLAFYYYVSRKAKREVSKLKAEADERLNLAIEYENNIKKVSNYNEILLYNLKIKSADLVTDHNTIQDLLEDMIEWDGSKKEWNKIYKQNHAERAVIEKFFMNSFKKNVYEWMNEKENNLKGNRGFSLN